MNDAQQVQATRVFGQPIRPGSQWHVTHRGLQQVTRAVVAKHKAHWFGTAPVVDVCCGLGGDTIALARRGETIGIDKDPDLLQLTAKNLQTANVNATLQLVDVVTSEASKVICGAKWLHIDPDRRADGKRHTSADSLMPNWSRVLELLAACDGGVVKLAPATVLTETSNHEGHRVWISSSGEVREQSYLTGSILDQPAQTSLSRGGRSALVVRNEHAHWFVGSDEEATEIADSPGRWLVDPDASIRAAGLTKSFAHRFGLQCIGGPTGFLTNDQESLSDDVFRLAKVSQVLKVMSCQEKRWRAELRARSSFPSAIKVRGTDHDPAALSRKLRSCGDQPVTLWIGRTSLRGYAAIAAPFV